MHGGFAGERVGRDAEAGDGRAGGADFDDRDAGDDVGHADGDEELVGAGGDLLEDVLAADVGVGGELRERAGAEADEQAAAQLHRCTLRIQRPKLRPIQVRMAAQTAARSRPR